MSSRNDRSCLQILKNNIMKKSELRNIIREVIREQRDLPTGGLNTWLCKGLYALADLVGQSGEVSLNHCTQQVYDWIENDLGNFAHPHTNFANIAGTCGQFFGGPGGATNYDPNIVNSIQFAFGTQAECEEACTPCVDNIHIIDRPHASNDTRTTSITTTETCGATITHILPPANKLKFQFSGPTNWAYEITGPDPLGNINTLMSTNNSSAQTVLFGQSGYLNPGTYTLNYQCDVNNQSTITLPHTQSITIP